MAYGDFEDLSRRKASDEILGGKVFNIVKNPKYGDQHWLASMVYKFFDKKLLVVILKMRIFQEKN